MTQTVTFTNPHFDQLAAHVRSCAARDLPMVERDRHRGAPGVVICSTGPSIERRSNFRRVRTLIKHRGYALIALKEALGFFNDRGMRAAYSVAMDPGGERQIRRTPIIGGVTYCLASSCHPELYDHLLDGGARVEVFHSACGVRDFHLQPGVKMKPTEDAPEGAVGVITGEFLLRDAEGGEYNPVVPVVLGETELYGRLFPSGDVMCGGYAVVNRAVSLARYMGFRRVVLAGADFGWRDPAAESHYASFVAVGPAAEDGMMHDEGRVDGTRWYTRPDQLGSAVDIAQRVKNGKLEIIGDSLAASLSRRSETFLNRVVQPDA